jgi:hypothetical protein
MDENGWGGTGLSGPKLENPDQICVRPPRIESSRVGTGRPRAGPDGSRDGNGSFFFQFNKKINKSPKTPKILEIFKKKT